MGSEHLHGRRAPPASGMPGRRQAFRRACVVRRRAPLSPASTRRISISSTTPQTRACEKAHRPTAARTTMMEGDERGAHYQSTFPGSRAARRSRSPRVVCKKRLPRVSRQPEVDILHAQVAPLEQGGKPCLVLPRLLEVVALHAAVHDQGQGQPFICRFNAQFLGGGAALARLGKDVSACRWPSTTAAPTSDGSRTPAPRRPSSRSARLRQRRLSSFWSDHAARDNHRGLAEHAI